MAGLGNITTTLITTKGLFTLGDVPPGFTALTFGAGITPWFRLYLGDGYVPPVPSTYVAAAGSKVYQPGEYAQSWKPVDPETGQTYEDPWMVVPRENEADYFNKGKIVTIRLVWNNKEYDKTYAVKENNAKRLVEVVNFVNASKDRIKVTISGVKKLATTAIVEVRNLVLRRKSNK